MKKVQEIAKKITRDEYLHLAENGVATLFEYLDYTFAEGDNYDNEKVTSYFIFSENATYLIPEEDMFEFVKFKFVYPKKMLQENMNEKLDLMEVGLRADLTEEQKQELKDAWLNR